MYTFIDLPGEENGLGKIRFQSETGDEEMGLASFIMGSNFVLVMKRKAQNKFEIVPKYVGEEPEDPPEWDPGIEARNDIRELRTLCSEADIKLKRTDKASDMVVKLKKHYAEKAAGEVDADRVATADAG